METKPKMLSTMRLRITPWWWSLCWAAGMWIGSVAASGNVRSPVAFGLAFGALFGGLMMWISIRNGAVVYEADR